MDDFLDVASRAIFVRKEGNGGVGVGDGMGVGVGVFFLDNRLS
jgi:hypothetical protein